jgi:hypothetical protein
VFVKDILKDYDVPLEGCYLQIILITILYIHKTFNSNFVGFIHVIRTKIINGCEVTKWLDLTIGVLTLANEIVFFGLQ